MEEPDLNLLVALDALLTDGTVAGAARRLRLSASAMSRTLTRLREATGDPLLVRAGRDLVPTPRALELRERVRDLSRDARAVLRPVATAMDLRTVQRTLTLRANDGFVEAFGAEIVLAVAAAAPGVRLRFAPKPDKDVRSLREGPIDLEIGVLGETGPEIRVQALFQDRFVGVVRRDHPLLSDRKVTPERYAAFSHVVPSRRGLARGPVDDALAELGLTRTVVAVVPGFRAALAVASASDLVALITTSFLQILDLESAGRHATVASFELPVSTPPIVVSQMWHPRFDADPIHRWLRGLILRVCHRPTKGSPHIPLRRPSRTSSRRAD